MLVGAAIVGSAVIYSFETSYSFFRGARAKGSGFDVNEKAHFPRGAGAIESFLDCSDVAQKV